MHTPDWHWQKCQSYRWFGGNKVNFIGTSSVAMNHFIGGKSGLHITYIGGKSQYWLYKPIQCPTGFIMTGTRMYGIGDGVDANR
ncbi:pilus assembly protein PilV [Escherichia coli]|uniref:pilus assembly protein PilV n=1 Tax=Escherichia coli TaxID=562 RepID=UPI003D2EBCF2